MVDDDTGEYLNIKQLSDMLGYNYNDLRRTVCKFEKDGLVKHLSVTSTKTVYQKVKVIAVNPYIIMNGEYIVEDILKQFEDVTSRKPEVTEADID